MSGHHSAGEMLYDEFIKGNPLREQRVEIYRRISKLEEQRYEINRQIRLARYELKILNKKEKQND